MITRKSGRGQSGDVGRLGAPQITIPVTVFLTGRNKFKLILIILISVLLRTRKILFSSFPFRRRRRLAWRPRRRFLVVHRGVLSCDRRVPRRLTFRRVCQPWRRPPGNFRHVRILSSQLKRLTPVPVRRVPESMLRLLFPTEGKFRKLVRPRVAPRKFPRILNVRPRGSRILTFRLMFMSPPFPRRSFQRRFLLLPWVSRRRVRLLKFREFPRGRPLFLMLLLFGLKNLFFPGWALIAPTVPWTFLVGESKVVLRSRMVKTGKNFKSNVLKPFLFLVRFRCRMTLFRKFLITSVFRLKTRCRNRNFRLGRRRPVLVVVVKA